MELSSVLALWSFQVARADLSSAAVNNLRSKSRAFEARSPTESMDFKQFQSFYMILQCVFHMFPLVLKEFFNAVRLRWGRHEPASVDLEVLRRSRTQILKLLFWVAMPWRKAESFKMMSGNTLSVLA